MHLNTTKTFTAQMGKSTKEKKEVKKAEKNKKKIVKLAIIIGTILILGILTSLIINVKIKLLFDTETHIQVSPSITSIASPNKTSTNISFTTTIDTIPTCTVICTQTLMNANQETIVNRSSAEMKGRNTQNYILSITEEGRGQTIYNYHINCIATERKLCPSKGKEYSKTAFVTLNYGLSAEEKILKDTLNKTLHLQSKQIARIQSNLHNNQVIIKALNHTSIASIAYDSNILERQIQTSTRNQEEIFTLWEQEAFKETQTQSNEQEAILKAQEKESQILLKTAEQELTYYNQASQLMQEIHNNSGAISNMTGLLKQTRNDSYEDLLSANRLYLQAPTKAEIFLDIMKSVNNTIKQAKKTYEEALQEKTSLQEELQKYNLSSECNNSKISVNASENASALFTAYHETYCPESNTTTLFTLSPRTTISVNKTNTSPQRVPEPRAYCCYQENCAFCSTKQAKPIILIHGHSFSKSTSPELAFTRLGFIQDSFAEEGHIHASTLNPEADIDKIAIGDWGKMPAPIVIRVTYYYLNYYDLGQLSFTTRKTDSIENYAIRLKEAIDIVEEKTGSEEVILIAHSMGGLVARKYLQLFGDEDVDILITLGTPNQGVEGDVKKYCTLSGAEQECRDMATESTFLKKLNQADKQPKHTKIYTIRAEGCPTNNNEGGTEAGDGVVLARSVILTNAKENYVVQGNCTDLLKTNLHMNFINTKLYPETFKIIQDILKENT